MRTLPALGAVVLVATGCAALRSRESGIGYWGTRAAPIVGSVQRIGDGTRGDQVAFQVDDSDHVAVFTFDSLGTPFLSLDRGGAGVVRAPRFVRTARVASQSAATTWSETRCTNGDLTNRKAFTAAELASAQASLPTSMVTCYSAPSSNAVSQPWSSAVKEKRVAPVLVIATRAPLRVDSAGVAIDLWARTGRDSGSLPRLAQLVAGGAAWSAMLYNPK